MQKQVDHSCKLHARSLVSAATVHQMVAFGKAIGLLRSIEPLEFIILSTYISMFHYTL
jgi:hypothetical protein